MYDLLLRDATLVSPSGRLVADVAIKDGRISYVGPRPPRRRSRREVSAIGKFLMPGVIDTAVRFGDHWASESAAAATGGVTSVVARPTASHPTRTQRDLQARHNEAKGISWTHFAFWADADDGDLTRVEKLLAKQLAIGAMLSLDTARLQALTQMANITGPLAVIDGVDEPGEAPLLRAVLELARSKDRGIHLLQLSSASDLHELDPVKGEVPVTAGVTPHHLFLSAEAAEELSHPVQTHPPIRPEADRRALWTALKRGRMDCVVSDHVVPNGTEGGIPGAELMLPLMLSAVRSGRLSLELLVELCAAGPARVLGLEDLGQITKGCRADLVLFAENELTRVGNSDSLTRAEWTPYLSREIAPKPEMVVIGGQVVAERGKLVGTAPQGEPLTA